MTSHDSYKKRALRLLLAPVLVAGLAVGCAPAKSGDGGGGAGGSSSSDSSSSGGSSSSSSSSSGGSSQGGSKSSSSKSSGGSSGGSSSSSSSSSSSGGSSSGGSKSSSSSSSSGGSTTGGSSSSSSGTSAGGAGGSSSAGGGSTASGDRPAGYFKTSDWNVSKVDWHGCVWTGKDSDVSGSDTSVVPADFTKDTKDGGPYKISGSVFNDYNSVALIGFNLNEAPNGKSDQCKNDPTVKDGPPNVTMPTDAKGIAINWTAAKLPLTFRIQIQGIKGATDANQRWCATIKDASGPSFVPWSEFNTTCWDNKGNAYKNEPIDAIAFQVPGTTTAKSPYDITIIGFAPGNSKEDAPGPAAACGEKTGTIGSDTLLSDATKAKDASTARAATQGKDCKTYIVNNNNWGQPSTTYQLISFAGNSFEIKKANGTASGQGVPASFPSMYVGANGNIAGGSYNTWENTGLPKAIKDITSAKSTFKWSGKSSGDFNACYDIWFAKSAPTAGGYEDGISGLLMVWLYKPGSRQPIGSVKRQANIAGQDYDVWIGPRGTQSKGSDDSGRPVISYVAKGTVTSFSADLKLFFDDAVKNGDADKSAGGTSQSFSGDWLLTDVFAGFELWSAGDGVGLKADEFTFALNK